jgi:Fe-S cluster assembly protein SufD
MILESASRFKFYKFEEESAAAFHFSFAALRQEKDSVFEGFSYAAGGRLCREEYQNQLIDSGILSNIGGIYLLKDQQNHDFTVLMDHFEPSGKSVQHFRGVVDGQARAVFQGKIHVRRSAQKTDGYQSHHALLLSATAEASAKPELEIYADDVKCSHGATAGQLDPVALFYLRSRGVPLAEARALLVESFLNGAVETVTNEPVRALCQKRVAEWLAARAT